VPVRLAIALFVLVATTGLVAGGVATLGGGSSGASAGRSTSSEAPLSERSKLSLQGEWLMLRIENAWLDESEAAQLKQNDRRIAKILRALDAAQS
jgi:hypothetical protein